MIKDQGLSVKQMIQWAISSSNDEKTADVCRRHGISSAMFYKYNSKYIGMDPSDAKRLRSLKMGTAS